jgi:hypothetical protein
MTTITIRMIMPRMTMVRTTMAHTIMPGMRMARRTRSASSSRPA